ncbi:MAG: SRPBCC domain-containing protein [Bacteriovorax sp.]|nr:SRPBCC domain-containing protein [Bacteriovorax sp.]
MTLKNNRLQVTKFIPAEQEKVFAAWTNPKIVEKWFCPEGMKAEVHEWNAVVGGNYSISMIDGEDVYTTNGTFLEIAPFHKLVFSYGWVDGDSAEDNVETLVTVELRNLDDGTDVTLTHEGVDPEEVTGHEEGWLSALSNLAHQFN